MSGLWMPECGRLQKMDEAWFDKHRDLWVAGARPHGSFEHLYVFTENGHLAAWAYVILGLKHK